jgi:hypothetical protein
MALTKNTFVDKAETTKIRDFYCISVREKTQILENNVEISSSVHRTTLYPDADVSTISDPVVLAQFNAVMTDQVKTNYQTFLASQEPVTEESSE